MLLEGCGFYQEKAQKRLANTNTTNRSPISYSKVHQAIFIPHCIKCHGDSGGVNLESYSSVKANLSRIQKTVFVDRTMPKNNSPLGATEKQLLQDWIQVGSPEKGDPEEPSPAASFVPNPVNSPVPPPDPSRLSYSAVREKVILPRCVSCHGNSGGINLETYSSIKENLARITIATLLEKSMPKGSPLAPDEAILLSQWIKAGSPENSGSTPPPVEEPLKPNFASIKKKVFDIRCTACHTVGGSASGVPFQTRKDLLDSPRDLVLPGNPEESGLWIAITREDNKRMPPPNVGSKLSDSEIAVIRQWIQDGAKE